MGVTLSYSGLSGKVKFFGTSGRFRTRYVKPLLLDTYPDAAVAYSLRKLRTAYTGAAIQVRRSTDGALLDIGFVNNVLDTTTLLTFIGANRANVSIWYDQSGNNNNAAVPFNSTDAHTIVLAGVLQTQNGKPSINFVDGTRLEMTNQISAAVNNSLFLVGKANSLSTGGPMIGQTSPGGSGPAMGQYLGTYLMLVYNGTNLSQYQSAAGTADTNFNIISQYYTTGPVATMYKNNSIISNTLETTYAASSYNFWNIGSHGGFQTRGFVSEVILYKSNQLSNGTAINTNINSYYSIY